MARVGIALSGLESYVPDVVARLVDPVSWIMLRPRPASAVNR